jgi:hypothetical protein
MTTLQTTDKPIAFFHPGTRVVDAMSLAERLGRGIQWCNYHGRLRLALVREK